MEDEPITIGGALVPVMIIGKDRKELMKILKPKIDIKVAMIVASLIRKVFNLRQVLNYPAASLSPYSHKQLLDNPEDVKKILMGISMASYISYLASKGYKINKIGEIMSSRKALDEKLSAVKILIIGYDYDKLKKDIKLLPENLRFPLPEPDKSNNLIEKLSDYTRDRIESIGVRYIDLVFIPVGGVIRSVDDILTWENNIKNNISAIAERAYVLSDAIERAYDLNNSIVVVSPAMIILPTASEREIRESLEAPVKNTIYTIEKYAIEYMGIYTDSTERRIDRDNDLIYI
jgi:hypothetical protein